MPRIAQARMQICVAVIAPSLGHVGPNTIKTKLTGTRWRTQNVSTFIHCPCSERRGGAKPISLRSPVYWFRNAFHVVRWPAQILLLVAVVCSQPSTGTPLVVVRASRKSVRQYLRLARFKAVSARCP